MPRRRRLQNAGMVLLRIGTGVVFLWFGVAQLRDPDFGGAYLPEFVYKIGEQLGIIEFERLFTVIHGSIEVALASALIVGLFTRVAALLLALQLAAIVVTVYMLAGSAIAIRDCGVLIATLVVFMNGPDHMSADSWGKTRPRNR